MGNMTKEEMKQRTKTYALRIIRLCESLPENNKTAQVIKGQLLRAGTSVGANYRAACRARSNADFINKLGIVEEETDESLYWMELIIDSELMEAKWLQELMNEGHELLAIIISSIKTSRMNK
jgi:four helix bundle protein